MLSYINYVIIIAQWQIQRGGGAAGAPPPPKIGSTMWFFHPILYQTAKNKAQRAQESMKKTLELPGSISGPRTPAIREFGLRSRNVRARI